MERLSPTHDTTDLEIRLLLEGIFEKYRSDFRNYTPSSIRRRLALALEPLGAATIGELQGRVMRDPAAYDSLLRYLTEPTSEMFRDAAYFKAIREQVVPILRTYPSIKIWIAGCSTGEEVYSFAILLKEEDLLQRSILYATDISQESLKKAQTGIYSLEQMRLFTKNYQLAGGRGVFSDYYRVALDSGVMDPELRSNVLFADHSLSTDSVFAEVQLVSCRNVLIYFNRELQTRAFGLFRDSLGHRGFLGLGSKETIRFSPVAADFEAFDDKARIWRRKGAA
jgi:chemotaxis protein methyltransferase CheR